MYIGDVIGCVVSTAKNESLVGRALLLVRRLSDDKVVVAIDSVGAGAGERVYVCRGREASFAFPSQETPSDATIVGIVDTIHEIPATVAASTILEDQDVPREVEKLRVHD